MNLFDLNLTLSAMSFYASKLQRYSIVEQRDVDSWKSSLVGMCRGGVWNGSAARLANAVNAIQISTIWVYLEI